MTCGSISSSFAVAQEVATGSCDDMSDAARDADGDAKWWEMGMEVMR